MLLHYHRPCVSFKDFTTLYKLLKKFPREETWGGGEWWLIRRKLLCNMVCIACRVKAMVNM